MRIKCADKKNSAKRNNKPFAHKIILIMCIQKGILYLILKMQNYETINYRNVLIKKIFAGLLLDMKMKVDKII